MDRLKQIGLTGGIGSGKSTVATMFARRGARVIDTDELAHQALVPGTTTFKAVVKTFGASVLDAGGTVNRARLGEIVFADPQQRQRLNDIIHPAVRLAWTQALSELEQGGFCGVAMVVIPLLYEVNAHDQFQTVITVACHRETQCDRLRGRGLSELQAEARIRAQWPLTVKMDRADFVVWNECSLAVLEQQVDRLWSRLTTPQAV